MDTVVSNTYRWARRLSERALLFVAPLMFLAPGQVQAAPKLVDAELLLLVDTSDTVSPGEFNALLDGYAQAFESTTLNDALAAGSKFGIAVSLVLFSQPGTAIVTVPWTLIRNPTQAADFATAIRNAPRPGPPDSFTSIAGGLDFSTEQFGHETGFTANNFRSYWQGINVTTETDILNGDWPAQVAAARDDALAAGVEVINGLTVGTASAADATNFYNDNVIGGWGFDHTPGAVVNAPTYADLPSTATTFLTSQIVSLIPEPGTPLLMVFAMAVTALRRKR